MSGICRDGAGCYARARPVPSAAMELVLLAVIVPILIATVVWLALLDELRG